MKGYRTVLINGFFAALPIAAEMLRQLSVIDWQTYLDRRDALWVMLIIGGLNIFLRRITNTAMGRAD